MHAVLPPALSGVKKMNEKAKQIAALMSLLANEHRLLILCALLQGSMTVGEISEYVPDISAPALSQHLHRLQAAGLISSEKQAQFIRYSIADRRVESIIDLLKREYCDSMDF